MMEDLPKHNLTLQLLPDRLMICRLPAGSDLPDWILPGNLTAVVRTSEELSIVSVDVPLRNDMIVERGWRALKVVGPLDFEMVGVLASLVLPLSKAGVSIFAISTFNTDYFLLKEASLSLALTSLNEAGHIIMELE